MVQRVEWGMFWAEWSAAGMDLAGPVKGIAVAPSGEVAVSCSTDCSVRLFRLPFAPFATPGPVEDEVSAVLEFQGRNAFRGIDHHWTRNTFGTAGAQVARAPDQAPAPLPHHSLSSHAVC